MADTDSVYRTIQHILETYDGISSTDIDYNNMAGSRGRAYWKVGRQVADRKKSSKYLDEICQHSFVSMFPTRTGKRGIKAWRDDTTVIAAHDDSKILKDSSGKPLITKFEKIPLSKVYNDIEINYDWNPGLQAFNKSITITNADQSAFPTLYQSTGVDNELSIGTGDDTWVSAQVFIEADGYGIVNVKCDTEPTWASVGNYLSVNDGAGVIILYAKITSINEVTGDWYILCDFYNTYGIPYNGVTSSGTLYDHGTGVPEWTTYVSGVEGYVDAKIWWLYCRSAYQETHVINKIKFDCKWYYDNTDFDEPGGTNDTPFYLLQELMVYCTKQKYHVEYHLPITAANLQLELNDPITFNDVQYTDSTDRLGYINKIKIIPSPTKPMIMIDLILNPYSLEGYNLIIETGSAPDTIIETGSQTDTYTEGAQ